jgi:adenosine deaminase
VVIAANRTRHPLDARTLARLAGQYADRGVVGFGLSNDERRGSTDEFAAAFRIAERAGLRLVPHGGELAGPANVRVCLDRLHAHRLGHGVRATEDPALLAEAVRRGVCFEVCPVSNVALGVYSDLSSVPLPALLEAGATVALGADDPLLFGSRLTGQYATMRAAHDLSDEQLAELACMSIRASCAPDSLKRRFLGEVAAWLADCPS